MVKNLFIVILGILIHDSFAQVNLYRCYQQSLSYTYYYCDTKIPVKTNDGGYIFSLTPWNYSLHGGSGANITFKTDSNFVPQWRKPYLCNSISLPTGGIILMYDTYIEKITPSGTQVWIKSYYIDDIHINSGALYGNKIRLVGGKHIIGGPPFYQVSSQPYTMEIDTMGVVISQSLFTTSYGGDAEFSSIKRDALGNFFVSGGFNQTGMVLAKFDPNFNVIWTKNSASPTDVISLTDFDVLPDGSIFATGVIQGNYPFYYALMGALLKFDSLGNLVAQKYIDNRYAISGLCKKGANYVVTMSTRNTFPDSTFIFETDTSMTISWYRLLGEGIGAGTPILKDNTLYSSIFKIEPYLVSTDLNGVNCMNTSQPYTQLTSSVQLSNFTLTPITFTVAFANVTLNVISPQSYVDSCKCGPSVISNSANQNICIGNATTVNLSSPGMIYWYTSQIGTTAINSGTNYTYGGSMTPTIFTLYVADSICSSSMRTPIIINVNTLPTVTITSPTNSLCSGESIYLTAIGANSYTWSTLATTSVITITPSVSQNYVVTGANQIGCSDTETITIVVHPSPTIMMATGNNSICIGDSAIITAHGAATYLWSTSSTDSIINVNPNVSQNYSVTGFDVYGCSDSEILSINVYPLPTISVNSGSICSGESFTLFASGASSYTFSSGSPYVNPITNTVYSVSGTSSIGCISSNYGLSSITVFQPPTVSIVASAPTICVGEPAILTAYGASYYFWSTPSSNTSVSVYPTTNTNYSVTGYDDNNCSSQAVVMIQVDLCTNLSEQTSRRQVVQILPNPTQGVIKIIINNEFEKADLQLYNSIGELIFSEAVSSIVSFNLSDKSNGLYYLKVKSGSKQNVLKIIKE